METPHLPPDRPPLPDDRRPLADRCIAAQILDLIEAGELTAREASAWVLYEGLGWPQWRIARLHGVCQQLISREICRCRGLFRKKR